MAISSTPNKLFLLVSLLTLMSLSSSSAGRVTPRSWASTEFIRSSCVRTTYPTLCMNSLSSHASAIETSPQLLAHTALSVTLDTTRASSTMMSGLMRAHGLRPRDGSAVKDCLEQLRDSVDELSQSLAEMGRIKSSNFGMTMSDVQTWVSAAETNEDTCTEGLGGAAMSAQLRTAVRARILNIAHLTSNALALVNSYASLHG